MARIFNPWLQNRTLSFWTKHSIVKNLFIMEKVLSYMHKLHLASRTPSQFINFTTLPLILHPSSRTSLMFLSVLKNAIISPHLSELCDRNTRISHLIPHQFPHRFKANEFRQLCSLKNIMRIKKSLRLKTLIVHISNSWVQNRTVSFWTKHSIVKNLFKKQNISTSHLHNFQCSSEPSKTPSFQLYLVNFVIEILAPRTPHLAPHP